VWNKPRAFFAIAVFFLILLSLPVSKTTPLKSRLYSVLKAPVSFSKDVGQATLDLFQFRRNASEMKSLRHAVGQIRARHIETEELRLENERLTRLFGLRSQFAPEVRQTVYARVVGKSPSVWNSVLLIDKGREDGVALNMLALCEFSLVGKTIEIGPRVSKVLLINDPNSRIGAMLQRTRQSGVLYGTVSGECRLKYLSLETEIKPGDVVETAGFTAFFPKGLAIGKVARAWKEPGQSYQVAEVKPFIDFSRIEEVACVE